VFLRKISKFSINCQQQNLVFVFGKRIVTAFSPLGIRIKKKSKFGPQIT
jgi:hypothetical protein